MIGNGKISRVMVIVLEDEPYPWPSGPSEAPFLTSLISKYAFAGSYSSISFPSLAGYMALTGGSKFGIDSQPYPANDAAPPSNVQGAKVKSIGYLFDKAGLTWKAYMEDLPSPCYAGDDHDTDRYLPPEYSVNHDPFVYYETIYGNGSYPSGGDAYCQSHVVGFNVLRSDLAGNTLPNFAFIVPDEIHTGGDNSNLTEADSWVNSFLTPVLSNYTVMSDTVIFITFDDSGSPCCHQIYTIAIGNTQIVKQNYTSDVPYNHYSLLATIENIFSLGNLGQNDATARPMGDLFVGSTITTKSSGAEGNGTPAIDATGVLALFTTFTANSTGTPMDTPLTPNSLYELCSLRWRLICSGLITRLG